MSRKSSLLHVILLSTYCSDATQLLIYMLWPCFDAHIQLYRLNHDLVSSYIKVPLFAVYIPRTNQFRDGYRVLSLCMDVMTWKLKPYIFCLLPFWDLFSQRYGQIGHTFPEPWSIRPLPTKAVCCSANAFGSPIFEDILLQLRWYLVYSSLIKFYMLEFWLNYFSKSKQLLTMDDGEVNDSSHLVLLNSDMANDFDELHRNHTTCKTEWQILNEKRKKKKRKK